MVPSVVRRRVVSALLAVLPSAKSRGFVTIAEGSIIETSDDLSQPGLRSIQLQGREFLAFTRDIQERAEPLDSLAEDDSVEGTEAPCIVR